MATAAVGGLIAFPLLHPAWVMDAVVGWYFYCSWRIGLTYCVYVEMDEGLGVSRAHGGTVSGQRRSRCARPTRTAAYH